MASRESRSNGITVNFRSDLIKFLLIFRSPSRSKDKYGRELSKPVGRLQQPRSLEGYLCNNYVHILMPSISLCGRYYHVEIGVDLACIQFGG